ncbi:tetratricopeptide repeat protein [Nitrosopumilus sp. K4]|uniref:tetratricopeptide repeat protein n=1 Tax=Nitrosopumilus sp. K4 TaxID=2795383 RepID=UPI001BA90BDE|nr:tetratricopeptide repeat protein [Nitrosopumilus sp. K4]QUC64185.1 tetratricopeptide repeat protein [Nitrosopumilus sp. K4]
MLGYKVVTLLVLTVVFATTASDAFAESIFVKFDKGEYQTGDALKVTGQISDVGMPVIAMSIYDPNGTILSANSVEVEPDGLFTKTIFLDSPFYEESGEYKIKLAYGQITQNEYFVITNSDGVQVIEEPATPEIITLTTDKPQYTDGDTITILGTVSVMDSPTVLIGIYDTFGSPAGFYFGNVNSDLSFSTNFLAVAGVNFKVDGTYSIKAHYAESSKDVSFDFFKIIEDPIEEEIIFDEPEVQTDEPQNEPITESDTTKSDTTKSDTTTTEPKTTEPKTTEPKTTEPKTTEPKTTKTNLIEDDKLIESPTTETPKQSTPEKKSIIQTTPQEKPTKQKESKNEQIKKETPIKKTAEKKSKENENEDNLSVEDIALGIMLNQINLKCDTSKYVDSISYYDGMGPALYRLCKFDQSLEFFNQSLMEDPENVEILVNKGSALRKLGFYSEAILYYDQALAISPDYVPAINNKANALANMGNLQDAKSLYGLALEKNQNYVTARTNLLLVNEQLNQIQSDTVDEILSAQNIDLEEKPLAFEKPITPKKSQVEIKKETPNFFDELTMAFSSLFGFK